MASNNISSRQKSVGFFVSSRSEAAHREVGTALMVHSIYSEVGARNDVTYKLTEFPFVRQKSKMDASVVVALLGHSRLQQRIM